MNNYTDQVFINSPFDEVYKPLFDATIFVVLDSGFVPRCALEMSDASQFRLEKINEIISNCKYGIHDISRTELDPKSKLPRFNMPFELGLFFGAKRFGKKMQNKKVCLVLDRHQYRYQKMLSDISGMDIRVHKNKEKLLISEIRDWLQTSSHRKTIPSGGIIYKRFKKFREEYGKLCSQNRLLKKELTFSDYVNSVAKWLEMNG